MPTRQHESIKWTVPIELLASAGEGQPRRWSARAYNGGPMPVDSPRLDAPIVVNLKGVTFAKSLVANLFHDETRIVGAITDKRIIDGALDLEGNVNGGGADAQQFIAAAESGFPWQASIEADQLKIEKLAAGKTATVNGRTVSGPLYIANHANVYGVAFLGRGADQDTSVTLAASFADPFKGDSEMKYSEWLAAIGIEDESKLTDAQRAKLKAMYEKEEADLKAKHNSGDETAKIDPPKFDLDRLKAEYAKHEAAIESKVFEYDGKVRSDKLAELKAGAMKQAVEMKSEALQHEWTPERFEVNALKAQMDFERELFKAEAPVGPAIHSRDGDTSWPSLEAAFCRSVGLKDVEKHFKPEVLEASDRYKGITIGRLLLIAAKANGYTGMQWVDSGNLRDVMRAAFTTHNITDMLTRTGAKMLSEGFALAPATWREVCSTKPVKDFKATRVFRMTDALEYHEIGPGGEFHHGALGQSSYDIQAKTYGRMLALTRTDIINDDLGAFDDIRRRLGMYAGITINKAVWTAWLALANGGVFWTAARSNYQSGAATTLTTTGLTTAIALYRQMRMPAPGGAASGDETGLLNLYPTKVIVPPELEAAARALYVSQEMRNTTASTKYPTTNIWYNQFRPVVVPEISDSGYTGYSATQWFLAGDPGMLASMNVCFLNGVEQPIIESTDADFETLGIRFRAYTDFGVDDAEYQASFHSAGA